MKMNAQAFGPQRGGQRDHGFRPINKQQRSVLLRLTKYVLAHYRFSVLVVAACILVASVTTVVSTLFTKTLIDDYIVPLTESPAPDYYPLLRTLFLLGAVLLAGVLCSYVHSRLMIKVGQGTMLRLRQDLFRRMESLPVAFFDSRSHGDIMSVYTNDVDSLRQMIGQALPAVFSSLITITVTFVSMLVMSVPLTLVSIALAAVMMWTTTLLGKRSRGHFRRQQQSLADVNGFIEEMVSGQKIVKVFCHEQEAIGRFEQLNERLRDSTCRANQTANIVMPVNGNLGNLGYVLIAVVGAGLALSGSVELSLGTLVSFLTLNKNFTQPVSHISQQINSVLNAAVGAERVFALMDEQPEDDGGQVVVEKDECGDWQWRKPDGTLTRVQGDVDFHQVDFSYVEGKQVLFDININSRPTQKIAFVGGTGAGKTTIINLINRFYEIQHGAILYDGIPVSDIRKSDLRRSQAIVLQETRLFTGSVLENIRYGRLDATDEECMEAARLVCADDFIRRLAKGYHTLLTADGCNLSQGERQLLAIARAAVANPPVLILDEATSSIDTRTEQLVQRGMDQLMQGRTTFVIAHRLSTVHNADCILVLDHGRILEDGTYDELIANNGFFAELVERQRLDV